MRTRPATPAGSTDRTRPGTSLLALLQETRPLDTTIAEQLAGLSSAVLTVYTQLIAFTEPVTVDDIAQAAQTARSSTLKALVTIEQRHLAHRDRGNQNGPKRRPDLWRAHHSEAAPRSNEPPPRPGETGRARTRTRP
ncbi:hypothetical protein [Streptomyces sp. NBC_00055]|uniref:hypothetical protein n=1 Tax=Streptomyces sp. NBC_00055 TaxID=2975632 RepID=UPI00324E7CA0